MKHSKKIFWSLLIALPILMMASGCSKFLDRKPLTATLEDLNQGGLEGQIFGLYSNLRNSSGFTSIPWLAFHDFRSDDSEKGSDPSDGAEWSAPFDKYAYVKDLWASNQYWNDHYSLINLANTAIQTADSLKLTDPSSVINVAEARFLRAYAYFDMVRSFGEVPKIDFRIYNASQANIAKSPVSEIYKLIDDDLTFAAQNLPINWVSGADNKYPGRLTSGAAKTLQAKAFLFRANWGQTLGLCQQVIASQQYSLFPSYYGIFKDAGENCSESIFEIQAYVSPNGAVDNGCGFATTQGVRASTASGWNLGWGWNTPTDSLVGAYETGDVRKGSTILFSGQSDDPATGGYGRVLPNSTFDVPAGALPRKYWNKKIYADPAYRASTGHSDNPNWINKRILRYADIILMAAEASNETGNGAQAATYLNQVRARVSMPAVAFVNQAQMRAAIKHERRVEFGMEGERFFDLVRWGDAVSVLGPLGYTNRCRYYPIPQPAIDKSGGKLIQNPEW
jgi:hypothetical protein